jgi:hypothetical protein
MKRTILLLSICTASMMLNAANIYVSPTGNDISGDGSQALPIKTFAKAVAAAKVGIDTIFIAAGTYMETTIGNILESCPNLVIKGAGAKATIIDGSGIGIANGRILKNNNGTAQTTSNNTTIMDLTFTGAGYGTLGVNAGGGAIYFTQQGTAKNNLTLERVIFDDNWVGPNASGTPKNGGALYFNGNNLTIKDCYFKNNKAKGAVVGTGVSNGGAIFITPVALGNGTYVNISNTTFEGNEAGFGGAAITLSNSIWAGNPSVITFAAKGATAPNSTFSMTNCTFLNNKATVNPKTATDTKAAIGVAFTANTGAVATPSFIYDITIANCTFADNVGGSSGLDGAGASSTFVSKSTIEIDGTQWASAKIVNNIVNASSLGNCGFAMMASDATGTKITGTKNIIESVMTTKITDPSFYTAGANATNVAPTLTDNSTATVFAVPYLALSAGSSAIDAGVNTFGTPEIVPATDVTGATVVNTTKDLGAYEFGGVAGIFDTKQNNSISVYPNPALSTLYIDSNDVQKVDIYSISGTQFQSVSNGLNAINVAGLESGLYLINVKTSNKTYVQRFVKK